jgi:hypothetical protein
MTRILTTVLLLIAGFGASVSASAARLDVNLNQDSARFTYYSLIGGSTYGRTEMSTGVLYNQDKNYLLELGLQVVDVAGSESPGLEIGVGPKLFYMTDDEADVTGLSIAIGGIVRYNLPQLQRLALQGSLYYAPSITSTLDTDAFLEYGVRVAYEILPTANVYLGYRRIRVDYTKGNGSHTLDDGSMLGLDFSF